MDRLHEDLSAVSRSVVGAEGLAVDEVRDQLEAVSARVRHSDARSLSAVDESGFRADLDELLGELGEGLEALALAVEATHFAPVTSPQPYSLSGAVAW